MFTEIETEVLIVWNFRTRLITVSCFEFISKMTQQKCAFDNKYLHSSERERKFQFSMVINDEYFHWISEAFIQFSNNDNFTVVAHFQSTKLWCKKILSLNQFSSMTISMIMQKKFFIIIDSFSMTQKKGKFSSWIL